MKATELLQFPEELKSQPRWVVWKFVKRGDKTTKLPYQPSGKPAESNNPATWVDFGAAIAASEVKSKVEGVGCMISEPYVAIDFDHVRDPKTGEVERWAWDAIVYLNSYTELSPSGTGFHVWCYGRVAGAGKRKGRCELYASGRYFTVTALRETSLPATINPLPSDFYTRIEILDPQYKSANNKVPDSGIKNERVTSAQRIYHLERGDWASAGYPSQSEADCAYCVHLAGIFNGDQTKIDAAFRASKLFREKWDVVHGPDTYGNMTIAKALVNFKRKKESIRSLKRMKLSAIKPELLTWLWPNKVPMGKVTLFSGPPGIGKSSTTDDLCAKLSRGELGNPAKSVIMSAEDDPADTLVPRLMGMGANLDLIEMCNQTTVIEGDNEYEISVALDSDLSELVKMVKSDPEIKLLVIDPISNYLGKANMNREQEVRAVLMPLVMLASEYQVAIIIVGHFNKMKDGDAITRQGGATALSGVPRVVWNFTKSSETEGECLMSSPKNAHLKSLRYKIVSKMVPLGDGRVADVGVVEWLGEIDVSAEDVLTELNDKDRKQKIGAKRWLAEYLADGKEQEANAVVRAGASACGCSESTIRRAAEKLGIKKRNDERIKHKEYWTLRRRTVNSVTCSNGCRTQRDILRDRFRAVIIGAGYGPRAVDSILEEYFEKYMQDVPQFETMLKEYEENKHVED